MTASVAPRRIGNHLYRVIPPFDCFDARIETHPITKVTARRVYYDKGYGRTGFVDRQELEANGRVWVRAGTASHSLYVEPPRISQGAPKATGEDLTLLRREMADAHPDRGGDRDTFMAARERYLRARRRSA